MLNMSALYFTTAETDDCFHFKLNLNDDRKNYLKNARTEIRGCLRFGIPEKMKQMGYQDNVPCPRFFTQGSWAYKTLNKPAQLCQQADLDDGCYLPMSFVSETYPSYAAHLFFSIVESVLDPLVKKRDWKLIKDKKTCVRIEIAKDAHIDIPLYAIQDKEFLTLQKNLMSRGHKALFGMKGDTWSKIASEKVLLAHREKNWISSDPRPIKDWFLGEVEAKGEQLRRIVRYLKAFRDWQWSSGGPSSLLLMATSVPLFTRCNSRDDMALLEVVKDIPDKLRAGVNNPVDPNESLTAPLGNEGIEEAAKAFKDFYNYLQTAINNKNPTTACELTRKKLGERFPNDPSRVVSTSVEASIKSIPAYVGSSELVGRTKAG